MSISYDIHSLIIILLVSCSISSNKFKHRHTFIYVLSSSGRDNCFSPPWWNWKMKLHIIVCDFISFDPELCLSSEFLEEFRSRSFCSSWSVHLSKVGGGLFLLVCLPFCYSCVFTALFFLDGIPCHFRIMTNSVALIFLQRVLVQAHPEHHLLAF